jgi:tetratricopeptide (TPR) repeat protein
LQQGRLTDAVAAFEELVEVAPTDWEAWCGLGECHYALGDLSAAEHGFDRCLELNPDSVEAGEGAALIWAERDGDYPRSLRVLEELLEITTDAGVPEYAQLSIAWVHYLRGDLGQARRCFDEALEQMSRWEGMDVELDAPFAEVEYRIGVLSHSLRSDPALALEHLQRAARLSPESIFAQKARELTDTIARGG